MATVVMIVIFKTFILFVFPIWIISVPDESYSKNVSCAPNYISTCSL